MKHPRSGWVTVVAKKRQAIAEASELWCLALNDTQTRPGRLAPDLRRSRFAPTDLYRKSLFFERCLRVDG